MSSGFLQRIKQKHALNTDQQTGRLFYQLMVAESPMRLQLSLVIAVRQPDGLLDDCQPYAIQRIHLQQPPRFLDATDVALLMQLCTLDTGWQNASEGRVPDAIPAEWVCTLAQTGRAYWKGRSHPQLPLVWGTAIVATAAWTSLSDGGQQLEWVLGSTQRALPLQTPLWLDSKVSAIGIITTSLHADAIALVQQHPVVGAEAVDHYCENNAEHFQRWQLHLPQQLPISDLTGIPVPRLHFWGASAELARISLEFEYSAEGVTWRVPFSGCIAFNESQTSMTIRRSQDILRVHRNDSIEHRCLQRLNAVLPAIDALASSGLLPAPHDWRDLMLSHVPQWRELGWHIDIAPEFCFHYVQVTRYDVALTEGKQQWFDIALGVRIGGDVHDLLPLLKQCKARYRLRDLQTMQPDALMEATLSDGRRLCIPVAQVMQWLRVVVEAQETDSPRTTLQCTSLQLTRWYTLLTDAELPLDLQDQTAALQKIKPFLSPLAAIQTPLPVQFGANLRDYQRLGVAWLQHLRRHDLGGILADDMGLGKTVQIIAHLVLEQQAGRLQQPALVVMPTSLLGNWQRETARFAPWLRCVVLHGPQRQRYFQARQSCDVLFTTYTLLANDIELWQQHPLSVLVLDEAQAIKNPRTRAARALRQLTAAQKICLSGTPMENHLGELWALFDVVLPGFLFSDTRFQRYYRTPIEKDGDTLRLQDLLEHIKPFMLRRRKDDVAKELPPKTEMVVRIPLHDAQRDLYESLRAQTLEKLQENLLQHDQTSTGRVLILNALMQLRQLCCDPGLSGQTVHRSTPSAKRERCLDMVKELTAEGRKVLLFSQFTRMLDLLADDLAREDISYLMLTGQSRDRDDIVRRFQAGEASVFLISLKAGGVGLNLVEADTVIHYDPWWNSAAEAQASDRAWRIGQDKPVFVYKLIMQDTVEEKILALQQHKQALLQAVFASAENNASQLRLDTADLMALLEPTTSDDSYE